MRLSSRHVVTIVTAGLLGVFTAAATAGAGTVSSASPASAAASGHPAKLGVGVEVLQLNAAGRKLTGTGLVTAKLTDGSGHTTTVKTKVALAASAGKGCTVLTLDLQQLNLVLLGLTAHLDKVHLTITGNSSGGVLGSLFCKLAKAKVSVARASAARALNAGLRRHRQHMLRFTTWLTPQASRSDAATATCPVLDLIVGPLSLKLLGLQVDLNQVHLNVTATRGGGALGDLFCKLADNSTTTTSTSSTTTSTTSRRPRRPEPWRTRPGGGCIVRTGFPSAGGRRTDTGIAPGRRLTAAGGPPAPAQVIADAASPKPPSTRSTAPLT